MILGDKFGHIHLFDAQRKQHLDTLKFTDTPNDQLTDALFPKNRRVNSVDASTLEWYDTHLTYIAVSHRGSQMIDLCLFLHNENKLRHIYTYNVDKSFDNFNWINEKPEAED